MRTLCLSLLLTGCTGTIHVGRPDAGAPEDLTDEVSLSGQVVYGLGLTPLAGVTVTLDPGVDSSATTDSSGNFSFAAVRPGSYHLTALLAGFQIATQAIVVADSPVAVTVGLEASTLLFTPPDGNDVPWLAFGPDGGSLYASTGQALWRLGDPDKILLWDDGNAVQPLGFESNGDLLYLTDCDGGTERSCQLGFGAKTAAQDGSSLDFYAGSGPFVVGDALWFAGPPLDGGALPWNWVTADDAGVLGAFYTPSPAPVADPSALALLTPQQALVTLSPGGEQSFQPSVQDYDQLLALDANTVVAVSRSTGNGVVLDPLGPLSIQLGPTTRLASGVPGNAIVSYVGQGQQWVSQISAKSQGNDVMVPSTVWPPLPSPDGRRAAFPGSPYVADFESGSCLTLGETVVKAAFSPDGSAMLLINGTGDLRVVRFDGPSDLPLEGTAVSTATFTPDGQSVVYAGGDMLANAGIFQQPAEPPAALVAAGP